MTLVSFLVAAVTVGFEEPAGLISPEGSDAVICTQLQASSLDLGFEVFILVELEDGGSASLG